MQYKKKNYVFTIHIYFLNSIYHIGHKSFKFSSQNFYHPLMLPYLFGVRKKLSILNGNYTINAVLKAFYLMTLILKSKGKILIVNTNPAFYKIFTEFNRLYMKNNEKLSLPSKKTLKTKNLEDQSSLFSKGENEKRFLISFCNGNWIGGTLTNWIKISELIKTYALFSLKFESFVFKNNINFSKHKKMKRRFEGLLLENSFKNFKENEKKNIVLSFKKKPDIILLLNPNNNNNVIQEAKILNIPIIAFTDSNTNLVNISYSIPTNNQSFSFYYYFLSFFVKLAFLEKNFGIS